VIIYHQNNLAAFAGNIIWYWPLQPLGQVFMRVAVSPAAGAANQLILSTRGYYGAMNTLSGGMGS